MQSSVVGLDNLVLERNIGADKYENVSIWNLSHGAKISREKSKVKEIPRVGARKKAEGSEKGPPARREKERLRLLDGWLYR